MTPNGADGKGKEKMEAYEALEMAIIEFNAEDVIVTSGDGDTLFEPIEIIGG